MNSLFLHSHAVLGVSVTPDALRARKGTRFAALAVLGAVVLAGCAAGGVDVPPAPGSPDLAQAGKIFADLPLMEEALRPFNEDESIQLRQQVELSVASAQDAKVEPQGSGCQAVLRDSFKLANLHWTSLAARSESGKSSAQIFLAPEEKTVKELLSTILEQAKSCGNATITSGAGTVKVDVKPYTDTACKAGYTQTVTRDGVSQSLDVCFMGSRNALLALAVADRSRADTAKSLAKYGQDFFARLAPLYSK